MGIIYLYTIISILIAGVTLCLAHSFSCTINVIVTTIVTQFISDGFSRGDSNSPAKSRGWFLMICSSGLCDAVYETCRLNSSVFDLCNPYARVWNFSARETTSRWHLMSEELSAKPSTGRIVMRRISFASSWNG